ncbi:MAG: GNAT family N-acetyltransferase [Caulobacteraceae bacterium]|nr:GNAT family N-acetyltransferase [Caulobacteraceae bacterium]
MDSAPIIRTLSPDEALAAAGALGAVLFDCVAGGASVSFMADLTCERAEGFWRDAAIAARSDGRAIIIAELAGEIVGVVQLVPVAIDNQPHRAEVAKMLVRRGARRAGVGAALMAAVEVEARRMGRWLLTLDTVTGEAGERLYRRMGWTHAGDIPDYALFPDGRLCGTSLFYKRLRA